ncbi:MAG: 2-oxoacid:acceptor oxidoreductase family protein [Oscillospiraceae bacterium]|nr:2-oxoacid:acceptor oxidoreductase family protein [Oscillospiraceae bacterium]
MTVHKMIFAGFGGQGILLIGQMLAYAGMREGREVTFLPSYGPEMRGGTANCTVIISDHPISCPIIDKASCVVAMNLPSLLKFESMIEPGGKLFINTSLIEAEPARKDIEVYKVGATEAAKAEGNEKVANIVMLGAVIEQTGVVNAESIKKLLGETFSGTKASLLKINEGAFETGRKITF